ncbi:hypothetical protein GLOIN_2v1631991, partial [Rhizophagus irregularis DAOM 181602=DAOM 197198]
MLVTLVILTIHNVCSSKKAKVSLSSNLRKFTSSSKVKLLAIEAIFYNIILKNIIAEISLTNGHAISGKSSSLIIM